MIQLSIQYSLQKKPGSQFFKTQSAPSRVKAVTWESVYEICDSCHFCQTAGASVLLKTTPPLESVAEVLGGLPWVTQRTEIENHPTGDYLKDSADLSFSLLFLSYLPRGNHSRGAPLLITVLLLLIQNVLQRLLLQKASLTVSAGPSLLAPSQPTWTNLEEQFLSACPFSHSRM